MGRLQWSRSNPVSVAGTVHTGAARLTPSLLRSFFSPHRVTSAPLLVLPTSCSYAVFAESAATGSTVLELDPKSAAAAEIAAVVEELLRFV